MDEEGKVLEKKDKVPAPAAPAAPTPAIKKTLAPPTSTPSAMDLVAQLFRLSKNVFSKFPATCLLLLLFVVCCLLVSVCFLFEIEKAVQL